tara:strand:+ start:77 stop:397 length:321 start_codon:yes stop_codon:yes gene_type:complete
MGNPIKFKDEDLKQLTDLREGYINTQNQLGRIKVQQVLAEQQYDALVKAEDELKQNYLNLTTKEQELVQSYNEEYGVGTVNIETGEFTPAEGATPTEDSTKSEKKS